MSYVLCFNVLVCPIYSQKGLNIKKKYSQN